VLEIYRLKERGEVLVTGRAVGTKIGRGKVHVIHSLEELDTFRPGEVLVARCWWRKRRPPTGSR